MVWYEPVFSIRNLLEIKREGYSSAYKALSRGNERKSTPQFSSSTNLS